VLDAHFATEQELAWSRGHQRNIAESRFARLLENIGLRRYAELLPKGGNWHNQKQFHFYPEFFDLPDGCVIDGTFQSEKFFAPVAKILKKHFGFRFSPSVRVAQMAAEIVNCKAVAVHFRRGDLVSNPKYQNTQSPLGVDYYNQAFEEIRARVSSPKYFIFSDDITYAKESGICPDGAIFVDCVGDWNSYDALRLMTLCKHFVIANSTFSWWGAWLSENKEKTVVRSDPWFANMPDKDTRDLCPEGCIAINR
jgi:hypothetical protein